jgi:cytochrome P450
MYSIDRLSFAGGVRTCIGWKFALYEMLALTVEIINNFELNITPDIDRLRREACLVILRGQSRSHVLT